MDIADDRSTTLETHSTGASMLMSDESGALTAIGWEFEGKKVQVTVMDLGTVSCRPVGADQTSPASALVYLDSAHVFVSSVYGDAVLLRLSMTESPRSSPKSVRKGKGPARDEDQWVVEIAEGKGSFEVRERWMNLAPLRDFVTVEGDGGVSHRVTKLTTVIPGRGVGRVDEQLAACDS